MSTTPSRRTMILGTAGFASTALLTSDGLSQSTTSTNQIGRIEPEIAGEIHRMEMRGAIDSAFKNNFDPLSLNALLEIVDDIAREGDIKTNVLEALRGLIIEFDKAFGKDIRSNMENIRDAIKRLRETFDDFAEMIANIVQDSIDVITEVFADLRNKIEDPRFSSTANIVIKDFRGGLNGLRTGIRMSRLLPPQARVLVIGASIIGSAATSSVYAVLN